MALTRVLVAEDHVLVRAGVESLVAMEPDLEVVATCGTLPDLLAAVERTDPDVVVTDIRMPPGFSDEGIVAATALRHTRPRTGVVVLSQFSDPVYLMTLIAEGSAGRGYLLKERIASSGELVGAIRAVAAGSSRIDPVVVEAMVTAGARSGSSPLHRLTAREREILAAVAAGMSNTGIAAAHFVTVRAVEKHINSIFAKLDLLEDPASNRRVKAVLLFLDSMTG